MKFPKKQAQRLIPEYLLDYTTKLNESHPDPTESWGGGSGGSEYTAGDGINISSGNVISVDNTIAKKSEIPTNYVTLDTEQTITKSKRIDGRLTVGKDNGNSMFIDANYGNGNSPLISMYNDTLGSELSIMIDNGNVQGNTGAYFTYEDDKGLREYKLPYQDREGRTTCTLATTNDIPSLDGYATQTWVQEQGYKTSITSSDITNALGYTPGTSNFGGSYNELTDTPTFATVATSGSYNDLTDKPTIPDTTNLVTIDSAQTISGTKTFQNGLITENTTFGMKMNIVPSRFQYDYNNQGTIERTLFDLPTDKVAGTEQEPTTYTLATTDDIPTVNNPTITFTQGGATKGTITLNQSNNQTIALDAGGGGGKLYLHKLHIKKYHLKDANDKDVANNFHLYYNITTSSNQPMTFATYKEYFTGDSTVSDYGFAASGKINIMGNNSGEASVTALGFTNNNRAVVRYYQSRNSSASNSSINVKFDSYDGFEDTVTEV